jgi:SAM-dependent methyltransferase
MKIANGIELAIADHPCPLCGGRAFETLARQDRHLLGLQTVGCSGCGLVQTNPRPTDAALQDFYEHHYRELYQGVDDPDGAYIARFHKDERLRYTSAFLLSHLGLGDRSRLLDYGCGEGSLFVALREAGYQGALLGVEPNARFARYAAEHGRAEVQPTLDAFADLDAVLINHVLEHLTDPVGMLRQLRARLAASGRLYIDVPDAERYSSTGDIHLAHIIHFTQSTLMRTVVAAGFRVTHCERHDPPHHPLSVRLVAVRDDADASLGPGLAVPATTATGEAVVWKRLREIDAQAWRWVAMKRLARIGPLRKAYRALNRRKRAA